MVAFRAVIIRACIIQVIRTHAVQPQVIARIFADIINAVFGSSLFRVSKNDGIKPRDAVSGSAKLS